ncbi:MAG: autotransporter assembly complex family protein [Pseudomonadota bacterium]
MLQLVIAISLMLCLALLPAEAEAKTALTYKLTGLDGELEKNAEAWLGDAPDSAQDRSNFLVSYQERLEDALKALGYYNPQISAELKRTDPVWSLDITVKPGPPVLIETISIQLKGDANNDKAFQNLLNPAPFKQGEVFNHGDYERFKNELLALGQERGYFKAQFSRSQVEVNIETNTAAIYLHYESGDRYRFGELQYGDFNVEPKLIAEIQTIHEGEYFDQSKLQLFQSALRRTGYFSGVVITPLLDKAVDERVPLSITLYPARRHSFDVGVGYSTDTEERVSLTWRTPRVNRYGHRQRTRLSYSTINPSGEIIYSIPLTSPLNDVLNLNTRLETDEYGDIDSRQWEVGAVREIRTDSLVYSYSLRELNEEWTLEDTDFKNRYLLPGFSIAHTWRRGSPVDPSGGFSQLYKIEGAADNVGSDINLLRLSANFRYVVTPFTDHRIVARTDLGAVLIEDGDRPKLAPSLAFFTGGSQSIRAFAYQSIGDEIRVSDADGTKELVVGGDRLAVASLEYQYYFTPTWRGAVFIDGGDAFDSGNFDLKWGPGFGVHYISPVGAIRVEMANSASEKDSSWRIVLNIGAEF